MSRYFLSHFVLIVFLLLTSLYNWAQNPQSGKVSKTYYANGQIHTINRQGRFGGCKVPMGSETFALNGRLIETVTYFHRLKKGRSHRNIVTLKTIITYHKNGKPNSVSYYRSIYEEAPVAIGKWSWYNSNGELIRTEDKYERK